MMSPRLNLSPITTSHGSSSVAARAEFSSGGVEPNSEVTIRTPLMLPILGYLYIFLRELHAIVKAFGCRALILTDFIPNGHQPDEAKSSHIRRNPNLMSVRSDFGQRRPLDDYGRLWTRNRISYKQSRGVDQDLFDESYGEDFTIEDLKNNLSSEKYKNGGGGWSELDLSRSGIITLSPEIRIYGHLTSLFLSNNKISWLPEDIFSHLPSLVCLDLSYNALSYLPTSFNNLMQLQRLYLTENNLTELPNQMGRFYRMKELSVLGNPLINPPMDVLSMGTETILSYLRERIPPGIPPPDRRLLSLLDANGNSTTSIGQQMGNSQGVTVYEKDIKLRVLSYNILADCYAQTGVYGYCPQWALHWDYRSAHIRNEILLYDPDIVCLQEVEAGAFSDFFKPELGAAGYSGVFTPKSRARTMDNWTNVDGCAIFYKRSKFNLAEEVAIEYQMVAMSKHKELSEDSEAFSRLITKDNIGLFIVLQIKEDPPLSSVANGKGGGGKYAAKAKNIIVANTHIHWNPDYRDVKLLQVQFMMEQLTSITSPRSKWSNSPLIICGDFNSQPGSGPYELMMSGKIDPRHDDLEPFYYGSYSTAGMKHPFTLSSAYASIGEPSFTNYTGDFTGVLDYIWFTSDSLAVSKILSPVEEEFVKETKLPNPFMNSDHIAIMAEFLMKKRARNFVPFREKSSFWNFKVIIRQT
ncbi:hypothetical protein PROFUN_13929 [Planoprotostelium fungivorum]|uniref:poly(A)-specific ribonuclease n=1 Tax=Planoprotostelium fungivorum TaxID=1890364 RepID=A0A2P6N2E7_9EUKA|nr:hypothetical protein PROFUN_13929 [Planoprotostelium fungivorum]